MPLFQGSTSSEKRKNTLTNEARHESSHHFSEESAQAAAKCDHPPLGTRLNSQTTPTARSKSKSYGAVSEMI